MAASVPLRAAERIEAARPEMGTMFRIVLYAEAGADTDRANQAIEKAFARGAQLNAALSDYLPQSELNRLSVSEQVVSEDLFRVLTAADRMARATGGAFDVTQGPVIRLWREARKSGRLPDKAAIREARSRGGYKLLKLNAARRTARLARPGMQLDLGGIAKGYAAQEMLSVLRRAGFARALVAASGDIALGDAPPGRKGWRVGLGSEDRTEELSNCGVSTSGDEVQFVEIGGRRYSHIVDPRMGWAVENPVSVTVVARDAMEADALATAGSVGSIGKLRGKFPTARFVSGVGRR